MASEALRVAVDTGRVEALRELLRGHPALVTALVEAPDIEPTSPLTYVGMARFYGYAEHERTASSRACCSPRGRTRTTRARTELR